MKNYLKENSYPVTKLDDYSYRFISEAGNSYRVFFSKFWMELKDIGLIDYDIEIYEFSFERERIVEKTSDSKVAMTILYLAESFLTKNRVVFFSSDNPTKRDYSLFRIYHKWYLLFKKNSKDSTYDKIDKMVFYTEKYKLFFSCYFLIENYYCYEDIEMIFDKILTELFFGAEIKEIQ